MCHECSTRKREREREGRGESKEREGMHKTWNNSVSSHFSLHCAHAQPPTVPLSFQFSCVGARAAKCWGFPYVIPQRTQKANKQTGTQTNAHSQGSGKQNKNTNEMGKRKGEKQRAEIKENRKRVKSREAEKQKKKKRKNRRKQGSLFASQSQSELPHVKWSENQAQPASWTFGAAHPLNRQPSSQIRRYKDTDTKGAQSQILDLHIHNRYSWDTLRHVTPPVSQVALCAALLMPQFEPIKKPDTFLCPPQPATSADTFAKWDTSVLPGFWYMPSTARWADKVRIPSAAAKCFKWIYFSFQNQTD